MRRFRFYSPKLSKRVSQSWLEIRNTNIALVFPSFTRISCFPIGRLSRLFLFSKDPISAFLPKGVIRGCANCNDCVKVTARWHPEEACLPALDDAPIFRPTEEEFKDTLKYIAKIYSKAERYGICRIVPPPSWRPPCVLQDKTTWEASKFKTHIQKVHGLGNLYLKRRLSRFNEKMADEMSKVAASMGLESCNEVVADSKESKSIAVTSEFENGPELTLKSFKKYADDFKRQYFSEDGKVKDPDISVIAVQEQWGPLIARIEGEYWRIVESPSEEIEVLCGTNLGCQTLGSGFPSKGGPARSMDDYSGYVESGWNLNNTPKLSGSLLPLGCYNTSAILVPQLFIGMCFASQFWRNEEHDLYSLSYMHLGDPKVWYSVPGRYRFKFVEVAKKLFPQLSKHPKLLHELVAQLSPSMLMSEGIPVYRCVQNHSEFVLIFPGAYHSEFSCGFNCSEAVCFAPFEWLSHGQDIVELYAEYCLKTSISHDRLLLGAAMEAVSTQWDSFAMKNSSFNNQLWKGVCGKDGILTKVLKSRVRNEGIRRKHLCNLSQLRELDEFDITTKRECCICLYDLYLSAASCLCSPNRYSCLRHVKELCSCAWGTKYFYFRYEIAELNVLVEALEGNLKAIHSWAKRKDETDALQELNPRNNVGEQEKPNVISPRMSAGSPYELNGRASNKNLVPASNWANEENKSTAGSGPAYERNVIASNKSVMPASERRGAKDEYVSMTCMFPSPDTSLGNNAHHSASSLSTQKNVAQTVVILLSDNED
ncbi:putative lysine-specific demethylase JMJ16 isoform X2 [Sesamum indicum]|uniref:Lysine-specific demethylase JMJ16 isoform X2 n=1 Tax=Sesamum indicum TaxID=4182 RepID=A0A6I9T9I1_SESIN|nr:putative lysine-specific demethylase JMJ16 isoform X2 [Sesamum indicum]